MIKPRLIAILSAGVLGLGLVSCSKETEIKYQQDNYQPKDILVEKADKSFTALNNLSSMDFSRQLVINEENVAPEHQIKNLVLSTSCRSQTSQSSSTHISNWPNPTTVKVLDILPTDILLQRHGEAIFCDISYTTTNSYNSTNTGKVSQLKILNLNSFSNLNADHIFSQDVVNWEQLQDKMINPANGSTGTIVCTDLAFTQTDLGNDTTLAKLLPLQTLSNSNPTSSDQQCRAIFRTQDAVYLSKVFHLEMPIIPPTISYSFSKRSWQAALMDSNQTVNFHISNPNSFPIKLKMDLRSRVLHFRAIYSMFGEYRPSTLQELYLDYSWNGSPVDPNNIEQEYIAPSNSVSTLTGRVRGQKFCVFKAHSSENPPNPTQHSLFHFIGFNMDLNQDISFSLSSASQGLLPLTYNYSGIAYNSQSALKNWDIDGFDNIQSVIDRGVWWNEVPKECH